MLFVEFEDRGRDVRGSLDVDRGRYSNMHSYKQVSLTLTSKHYVLSLNSFASATVLWQYCSAKMCWFNLMASN